MSYFAFYFRKGKNAAQAAKKLRDGSGDFLLKDEQSSGQPHEVDDHQIKAIIESDRHVAVREIEEILKILIPNT